jgi:hypothetical protein
VIFSRSDAARAAEVDKTFKALDPRAPDFAQKVDQLLSQLGRDTPEELRKKVGLLRYLAEHDLTPGRVLAGPARGDGAALDLRQGP